MSRVGASLSFSRNRLWEGPRARVTPSAELLPPLSPSGGCLEDPGLKSMDSAILDINRDIERDIKKALAARDRQRYFELVVE